MRRKKELEEQVIQKFPYRCPYCDQPISYDQFNLKVGENEIQCPSCKRKYIKVVFDGSPPPLPCGVIEHTPQGKPSHVKGEGKRPSVKGEGVKLRKIRNR
jgi:DNA-directed RNA polymerase subunit RPC12/RpoP